MNPEGLSEAKYAMKYSFSAGVKIISHGYFIQLKSKSRNQAREYIATLRLHY
jgi:hypothetical protein